VLEGKADGHKSCYCARQPSFLPHVTPPPNYGIKLGSEGKSMATLDWSKCPAVESVADRRSGAWVFRGTRMPVATVFENLEVGSSIEEIIEQYDVTREQIQAVLEFAARSLDAPPVPVGATGRSDAHPV